MVLEEEVVVKTFRIKDLEDKMEDKMILVVEEILVILAVIWVVMLEVVKVVKVVEMTLEGLIRRSK